MKKTGVCFVVLGILLTGTPVIAATQYVRFEGTTFPTFDGPPSYYDNLDLLPDQLVYFDIAFDQAVTPPGFIDQDIADYFQISLIGGNWQPYDDSVGVLARTVEHHFIYLELGNNLGLSEITPDCGDLPYGCPNPGDLGPLDWMIGSSFSMYASDFESPLGQYQFGMVQITYLGNTPPPPIPVPGALWLMISAITSGFIFKKSGGTLSLAN